MSMRYQRPEQPLAVTMMLRVNGAARMGRVTGATSRANR
jgi:hypothetical protein